MAMWVVVCCMTCCWLFRFLYRMKINYLSHLKQRHGVLPNILFNKTFSSAFLSFLMSSSVAAVFFNLHEFMRFFSLCCVWNIFLYGLSTPYELLWLRFCFFFITQIYVARHDNANVMLAAKSNKWGETKEAVEWNNIILIKFEFHARPELIVFSRNCLLRRN